MGLLDLRPTEIFAVLGLSDAAFREEQRRAARAHAKLVGARVEGVMAIALPARTLPDLQRVVRAGLPADVLGAIRALGFAAEEVSLATAIPRRTLVRRLAEGRFDRLESHQLMRFAAFIVGAPFFESTSSSIVKSLDEMRASLQPVVTWLRRPHRRLDGASPVTYLDTDAGVEQLCELLSNEHREREAKKVVAAARRSERKRSAAKRPAARQRKKTR